MLEQDIYIDRADWHVRVYHAVDAMWADEILSDLVHIGCRGDELRRAKVLLWDGLPNTGLTYSNLQAHETVMVIGLTTSGKEYWNSLEHEMNHLKQHISESLGIDPFGETISYISGEFIRDVYNKAEHLLCDCCRKKL